MVTAAVSSESRQALYEAGWWVIEVPSIPNPSANVHVQQWVDVGFTKLRLWQLTRFSTVVYIDADCVVKENVDGLFDLGVDFAAAPDIFPPDKFNAGVMVIKPNARLFDELLRAIPLLPSYDGGDTGFLNAFFPHWYTGEAKGRLSFGYNALRVMQWYTKQRPQYWETIHPLKIIHYCSSPKPWEDEVLRRGGPLEDLWWRYHAECEAEGAVPPSLLSVGELKEGNEFTEGGESRESGALGMGMNDAERSVGESHWNVVRAAFFSAHEFTGKRPMRYGVWDKEDRAWLQFLRDRHHACMEQTPALTPLVPLVVHQIWLGGPFPATYHTWQESWRRAHPQWEYRLWTDADLGNFPHSEDHRSHLLALMDNAGSWVEKSDVLRLDVLYAFGGLYVDTDFECLRPFDSLHHRFAFFAGLSNTGTVELCNGLMGSAAKHPLVGRLITSMKVEPSPVPTAMDIIGRSGPGHTTRVLMEASLADGGALSLPTTCGLLPTAFFYPLPNSMRGLQRQQDKRVYVTPETFAMHHWACSWQGAAATQKEIPAVSPSESALSVPSAVPTTTGTSAICRHTRNTTDFNQNVTWSIC
jgi:glycogenin glucosyltransferase